MNIKFLLFFIIFPVAVLCQELPPVINFNPNEYQAGNQNWMVSQGEIGNFYFANGAGLLEYNGEKWTLYPVPNNSIVRSVKAGNGRIYTGAYMEVGYWLENAKGTLEYTSLTPNLPWSISDGEQFWHIEQVGEILVFQSFEGLYILNLKTEEISRVKTPPLITNLFKGENSVYFQVAGEGLFTIKNTQPELVISPNILNDIELIHVSRQGSLLARKSIVLLKIENDILPLKPSVKSIAVIGPLADDKNSPIGNWWAQGEENSAVSVVEGIRNAVGNNVKVSYAKGAGHGTGVKNFLLPLKINKTDKSGFAEAVQVAKDAEVVVMVLGEDAFQTGEGRSQVEIGLKGVQ